MGCIGECIRESLIRDRIVLGIQNPQTRKRLLQERKLTLKKCIDICRSSETSASQMKIISGTKTSEDVNRVKENQEPSRPQNGKNGKNDKSRKSCFFCGGTHPFDKGKCPAWGHKCRQCGGRNHFASKCKKSGKRVNNFSSTDSPSSSVDDNEDIDYIAGIAVESADICAVEPSDNSRLPKEIFSEMLIDDKPIKFQVDCGSSINILPKEVVGNCSLTPTSKTLIMWNKIGHNENYCHESSKPQEIFRGVRCSGGKINSLDWSKSCTTHETSNNTLE